MSRKGRARTQESRLPTPVLAGSGSRVWAPCPLSAPMCSPVVGPIVGTSGRSSRNAHAPKPRHWHGTEQVHGGRRARRQTRGHCTRKGTMNTRHRHIGAGQLGAGQRRDEAWPIVILFLRGPPNDVDVRTVPCSSRTNLPCRRPRAAMTASTVNRQTVGEAVTAGPRAVGVAAAVGTVGRPDRCPSGWSRCSSSHSLGR